MTLGSLKSPSMNEDQASTPKKSINEPSAKRLEVILKRTENIVNELNPEHPRDIGPTNPA